MNTWNDILPEDARATAKALEAMAILNRKAGRVIYPPQDSIFRALELTPPNSVKIVICGQDPYHEEGQANGLAFSVNKGCKLPPSLKNIFQELHDDTGTEIPASGDLFHWARQGVLLLNAVLTVEEGKANSHLNWGWQTFTKAVLAATRDLSQPIVFILWGANAQKTAEEAQVKDSEYPRLLLSSPHPSPLSAYRGFFGSKPFSRANEFLLANGTAPINW